MLKNLSNRIEKETMIVLRTIADNNKLGLEDRLYNLKEYNIEKKIQSYNLGIVDSYLFIKK
jgi:hypothetical protein